MRTALVLLPLALVLGCSFLDSVQEAVGSRVFVDYRECIEIWPAAAPVPRPMLLSPTLEERTAGDVDVVLARLESTSSTLPEPGETSDRVLGFVTLDFHVLERLKPGPGMIPGTVQSTVRVKYDCTYPENEDRDREALVRVENQLQGFFDDRLLILFSKDGKGYYLDGRVSFERGTSLGLNYGEWADASRFLLQARNVGDDENPSFLDPLWGRDGRVNHTIDLREIRARMNAIIVEEVDRGVECVGALYRHRWYTRSGEERWYQIDGGELGPDNVPVECSQ